MSRRTTPIGFLPGDIDLSSHCMFSYPKKDDAFIRNIADFIYAGMNTGELCICAVQGDAQERIRQRMAQIGVDLDSKPEQLSIVKASDFYTPGGKIDISSSMHFWQQKLEVAKSRWKGMRIYGDVSEVLSSRTMRLKLMEYEALINLKFPMIIALCGYQTSTITRSLLLQARSVHPFIANSKSIRRNTAFLSTSKFLAGFYRFRRASKQYNASPREVHAVQEDFEELAARTPLTMSEIDEVKTVIGDVFADAVEQLTGDNNPDCSHIHVTYAPESSQFLIILWYHKMKDAADQPEPSSSDQLEDDEINTTHQLMDEMRVHQMNSDRVITMAKRYSAWWV